MRFTELKTLRLISFLPSRPGKSSHQSYFTFFSCHLKTICNSLLNIISLNISVEILLLLLRLIDKHWLNYIGPGLVNFSEIMSGLSEDRDKINYAPLNRVEVLTEVSAICNWRYSVAWHWTHLFFLSRRNSVEVKEHCVWNAGTRNGFYRLTHSLYFDSRQITYFYVICWCSD